MTTASKFWGLIVEPGKKYEQQVPEGFKLTMASLGGEAELSQAASSVKSTGRTTVMFESGEGPSFSLCSLTPGKLEQQPLDLVFEEGEPIAFHVEGPHAIHLTGYLLDDEDDMDEYDDDMYEDESACHDSECDASHGEEGEEDDEEDEDDEDEDDEEDDDEFDSEEYDEDMEDVSPDEEEPRIKVVDSEEEAEISKERTKRASETEAKASAAAAKKSKPEAKPEAKPVEIKKAETKKAESKPVESKKAETTAAAAQAAQQGAQPMNKTLPSGLKIQDVKMGSGPKANPNKSVWIHYKGTLTNGKQFDSSFGGQPLRFKLGAGEVVKGMDMGVQGMQVGGTRKLTIPANLAYGKKSAGSIPPNSTLIFEVQLVRMQ